MKNDQLFKTPHQAIREETVEDKARTTERGYRECALIQQDAQAT